MRFWFFRSIVVKGSIRDVVLQKLNPSLVVFVCEFWHTFKFKNYSKAVDVFARLLNCNFRAALGCIKPRRRDWNRNMQECDWTRRWPRQTWQATAMVVRTYRLKLNIYACKGVDLSACVFWFRFLISSTRFDACRRCGIRDALLCE